MRRQVEIQETRALNMRQVYFETIEELAKPYPSIQTSFWPAFNRMTGGFRTREFSILCGGTGVGKTTFLANLSAQLLKQHEKHFVLSVETGHRDFMKRVLSALSGRDLNSGEAIHTEILARVHEEYAAYLESETIEFSLYEDRIPVEQLMHDIRSMVAKGCKIAMIDNLNFFMEVTRGSDTIVEMDRVVHELIIFCKQVDVHIVMVMHPKKTDDGRVKNEFDIKGSSTAVQEAHNIFLLNRAKDDESGRFDRELKLAKMRRRGQYVGSTLLFEGVGAQWFERGFAK